MKRVKSLFNSRTRRSQQSTSGPPPVSEVSFYQRHSRPLTCEMSENIYENIYFGLINFVQRLKVAMPVVIEIRTAERNIGTVEHCYKMALQAGVGFALISSLSLIAAPYQIQWIVTILVFVFLWLPLIETPLGHSFGTRIDGFHATNGAEEIFREVLQVLIGMGMISTLSIVDFIPYYIQWVVIMYVVVFLWGPSMPAEVKQIFSSGILLVNNLVEI